MCGNWPRPDPVNGEIKLHYDVALLEDMPTRHFETGQPLRLRRGQRGAVEVEFAGRDGRAYALLPVPLKSLIVLHTAPEAVPA